MLIVVVYGNRHTIGNFTGILNVQILVSLRY